MVSQILMAGVYQGEPIDVMVGWSRMESQVFANVSYLDRHGQWRDDVPLILEAFVDVDERPTELNEAAILAANIGETLQLLDIAIPNQILGEVAVHIVKDAGNVIVRYHSDGTRELLSDDLV